MRTINWLAKLPYLLLIILAAVLFYQNYVPGTWLTGWDNLHPELNFGVNIFNRSLWGTWQEYQGLGVRAGNAHAADLLHQLFLYTISFLFAPNLLRYVYHLTALLVGAIGMYVFIKRIIVRDNNGFLSAAVSFIGAAFYMLNLGTMQYFYVPYEAFSHFFASLPWLLLCLFTYLDHPTKRTFLYFSIINLLAIPAFYIPTLFVVYLCISTIVLIVYLYQKTSIKAIMTALFTIAVINAYWLLPFIGFIGNGTGFVSEVKINRMFTEEAFLRNQKFGTLTDIPLLRGFLFDTTDLSDVSGNHDFIMRPWIQFLSQPAVLIIHYALFICILIGFFYAVKTKQPKHPVLVMLFGLALFTLVNDNPPTGIFFTLFQNTIPFFKQIFRFPFTKFIALASFTYAIGLSYFFLALCRRLSVRFTNRLLIPAICSIFIAFLVYANLPSFQGKLFYPAMRQKIPDEYFALFNYFKTQPADGKIASLPQPTFWGWTAYDWGYRGSGFPWYGIPQPIMDRAFDVWNQSNEVYYKDLSQALYTQQSEAALDHVLDTYDISYVWLDERVIMPDKPSLLAFDLTKKLLNSSDFEKVFSEGKQTVYRYKSNSANHGIGLTSASIAQTYPFDDLQSAGSVSKITETDSGLRLSRQLSEGTLSISGITEGPMLFAPSFQKDTLLFSPILPKVLLNEANIPIAQNPTTISMPLPLGSNTLLFLNNSLLDFSAPQPVVLYPRNNDLALYSSAPGFTGNLSTNFYKQTLRNCYEALNSPATLFGINTGASDVLPVFGRSSHPCIYDRLSNLLPLPNAVINQNNAVLEFTLLYRPKTDEVPTFCLTKEGEPSCFYQSKATGVDAGDSWKRVRYVVPLTDINVSKIWVKIELDADSDQAIRELTLKNFTVNIYTQPLFSKSFDVSAVHQKVQVQVGSGTTLTIDFPKDSFTKLVLSPGSLQKTKQNCFTLNNGTIDRRIGSDPKVGLFVRYSATDASSCDQFSYFDPNLTTGSVVQIVTRNIEGRPIKACLAIDPPGYCLFEDILSKATHTWKPVTYITPPIAHIPSYQYFFKVDNYAVGHERRVNDISSISVTSIPFAWLTSIKILNPKSQAVSMDPQVFLPTNTFTVSHPNPVYYAVSASSGQPSALMLNEAYDSGWIAWSGGKILSHVRVNNWANGWEIPIDQSNNRRTNPAIKNTNITIRIFFLPQILEWLGFALLPLPFIWLFIDKSSLKRNLSKSW